ncbi:hypothetical protein C8A00DRAFT_38769 [Chaetomidium leptoderma]|uniref:Uncharacterized protein n=1 Tax=Chaetomidium leptoderma TaxID=669021 RepID=A0AAN6ZRW7_9PEZI|nr:hypothetical protein C8A00DRAFT_38769 [Chaetomidium leptoderma]
MSAQPAEQQRALQELFADVRLEPKEDGPLVEDDTKRKIERIWKLWERFCRLAGIDSDRVWEDFLLLRDTATEAIKVFLASYVRNSTQMRFVLDAREREEVPAWIYEQLAPDEGLLTESPYRKIAARPSDIRKLLLNLWVKAAYIRCTPLTRLYLHVIDLLSGLGGFRPKSLISMKFSQFRLAFVTLPDGRSRLACQVYVERVKQKRRQKCRPKSSAWIEFTVMANPDPLFDLPGLIVCLGIARDAFQAGYTSPDDLYTRPLRERAKYVPLKWKPSMLDENIVNISDTTLRDVWERTCLVSGARDVPRYYCLRVGAGGRTQGALGEVLHCYIFSNSIDVFKNSYQASLQANLMELLTEEAKQDRPFLDAQGDLLFDADEDAPIDLTPEELAEFELRDDITTLRSRIREAAGRERTLLRDRCGAEIKRLSDLRLRLKRAEFFDQIDEHRARGIPTDGIRSRALEERKALSLTNSGAAIAQFLEASDMPSDRARIDESPMGRVTKKETKRGAPEALGSERIKRPRHLRGLDDTGAELVIGEDDSMTAGDTIEDDDGSDWDAGDDGNCSSDTSADGDEEDPETLATVFQALQGRAASKMAPCAATQNSPPPSTPNTVFSEEPPPPYTSRVNSPLKRGRF